MWTLLLALLLQLQFDRPVLEAESARAEQPDVLIAALQNPDLHIQRQAVRAIGRLERPELADAIRPLLESPDPGIRMETANAFAQMDAALDTARILQEEKDGAVRAVVYESAGRAKTATPDAQTLLADGLKDPSAAARTGAAKGLEAFFRIHRNDKPSAATISAAHAAFAQNNDAALRELLLLMLNAAGDRDAETLRLALDDPEPQVRRLAVIASKEWKDDPSYIVRYEALKAAPNCERAANLTRDPSDHVALLAIDLLGEGCNGKVVERIFDSAKDWRRQAHAIVALAKVDPDSARKRLPKMAAHEVWQARVYAAQAARILKDDATLDRLAREGDPNVMAAAITTPRIAIRDLESSNYGLVLEAARKLKGWDEGRLAVTALLAALERISRERKATSRDVRVEILERLREFGTIRVVGDLRQLLSDFDPVVAKLAAEVASEKSGVPTEPVTRRYVQKPIPPDSLLRSLEGATAEVRMREAGPFTLELIPEEAPLTVATFVQLAESGYYRGLTLHRVVPNFVLQGGSPGANEYVGQPDYMRDELGLLSHSRGTLGISTRGRDTGDAQIFINLVDNFRLDHNYTVFARVSDGMDNVDKIQEGDVIESIEIHRKVQFEF